MIQHESFLGIAALVRTVVISTVDGDAQSISWKGQQFGEGLVAKTIQQFGESELARQEVLKDPYPETAYTDARGVFSARNIEKLESVEPDKVLQKLAEIEMPLTFTDDELRQVVGAVTGTGKISIMMRDRVIIAGNSMAGLPTRLDDKAYEDPKVFRIAARVIIADAIARRKASGV